jgi:hypothetical protein
MLYIFLGVVITCTAIWVYLDATKNKIGKIANTGGMFNMSAGAWGTVTLLLWIVGFPAYLIKRSALITLASKQPIEVGGRIAKAVTLAIVGGAWLALSAPSHMSGSISVSTPDTDTMQDINNQVAVGMVKQYEMAKRNGANSIDLCVQAQLVSTSYLQAQNEAKYGEWKRIQKIDCQ